MRLVLFTGKGGVGKTTTAAATAACAAERGLRTLVASADVAHSLGDVLEARIGPEPREVAPGLRAIELDARVELRRHWGRIEEYLVAIFEYQGIDGVVAEELALLPGAEEIATLLAVEQLAEDGSYDLVVVDCAPTDSTLRLATLPEVAHGMLRVLLPLLRVLAGVASPVASRLLSVPLPGSEVFADAEALLYRSLRALQRRITDPETTIRLVVTPERMVIDEARRLYTELGLFEVACDAVVMNRVLPDAAGDEPFFREWFRLQEQRCEEVGGLFAPLPLLRAPLREDEVTGAAALAAHGQALYAEIAPEAVLSTAPRVCFEREEHGFRAVVPLPLADLERLDVAKVEDELIVTSGVRRRALKLPRRIAPLDLSDARLERGALVVHFAAPAGAG